MLQRKYVKDKNSGLVMDLDADFNKYMHNKESAKAMAKTKRELSETKHELSSIKSELSEMKELLQQLVKAKCQN